MKKRHDRNKQLSQGQKDQVAGRVPGVGIAPKLNSFVGGPEATARFSASLENLRKWTDGWACQESLLLAFTVWANTNSTGRPVAASTIETKSADLFDRLVRFVRASRLEALSIQQIDREFIDAYITWLGNDRTRKGRKGTISRSTQKLRYGLVKQLLVILEKVPAPLGISTPIDFPYNPYADSRDDIEPTRRLDDEVWQKIYIAAKSEALEIMGEYAETFRYINGLAGRPPTGQLLALRCLLNDMYPHLVPPRATLLLELPGIESILNPNGGLGAVARPLQPRPRDLIPFILLLAIYLQANTSSLLNLARAEISNTEVLGQLRTLFQLEKPRGSDYERSFANDENDRLAPSSLVAFIDQWSARLHAGFPHFRTGLFCFVTNRGEPRGFKKRNDVAFGWGLKEFFKRHGISHANLRQIRQTGLAIIKRLFGASAAEAQRAAGHSEKTHNTHYIDDDTRLARAEEMAELQLSQLQFISSGGKTDHRGALPSEDVTAATPGWNCIDIFNSPIAGQKPGYRCTAFGQCPGCAQSQLRRNSAYSLARTLQLREEIDKAAEYLDYARWLIFLPVRQRLDDFWIPSFRNSPAISAAKAMNLHPIGRLE